MKTLRRTRAALGTIMLGLGLTALPLATVPISFTGCSTNSQQVAYKSLFTVGKTADTAVNTWLRYFLLQERDLVRQNNTNALVRLREQDAHVENLYAKFQTTYRVAVRAASLNLTNPAPAELVDLSIKLVSAVNSFSSPAR